jgi:hypothetical protein
VTLGAAQSCGFPDHTFVDDKTFYGGSGNGTSTGGSTVDASQTGTGGMTGKATGGANPGGTGGTAQGGAGQGGTGGTAQGGTAQGGAGGVVGGGGTGATITGKEGGVPGTGGAVATGGAAGTDAGAGGTDAGPLCAVGLAACPPSACVDLLGDGANCGTCGHACTGGDVCKSGACAPPCTVGLTACGGNCVDLQTDESHCGGCANTPCAPGNICVGGTCVIDCGTLTRCGPGLCVDTTTDDVHCGNCTTNCRTNSQLCSGGVCQLGCTAPFSACGSGASATCVNKLTDDQNCNACGNKCSLGQACIGGTCTNLVENCQNGTDDDQDGKIDCADPDCQTGYTCASTPGGWNGPVALWSGTAGTAPSCSASGGYPASFLNANSGLVVPGYTCPTCSCAPATGLFCDDPTLVFDTSTTCAGTAPWQPQTFTPGTGCQKFGLCCTAASLGGSAQSANLEKPALAYVHGTCTATQAAPQFPATSWTKDVIGCGAAPTAAGGCGGAQCVPKPKAPFGSQLCVYRTGILACPVDYPNQNPGAGQQFFQTVKEGRSCSTCNCPATCGGTLTTYTDDNCTADPRPMNIATNACSQVPTDPTPSGSGASKGWISAMDGGEQSA